MPCIKIQTNTDIAPDALQDAVLEASRVTAQMLGKPESYVMALIEPNVALSFAGTDTPAAYVELKSLGLPEQQTAEFSQAICEFISGTLNIPAARTYIEFASPERHMWGWDNRTF